MKLPVKSENTPINLLLVLFVLLCGCDTPIESKYADFVTRGHYVKDTRTGLCFYTYFSGIAHVPCTEEVEKLVAECLDSR